MSNQCGSCKYFSRGVEEMVKDDDPKWAAKGFTAMKRQWNLTRGECRRHAPFTLSGTWPVVNDHSSCGDFKR